ncbi:MAG: hypothetical protein VX951_06410, partial [Planctomycetota bacterium]|nr:hypothetical protein [Planctomycetota bacterium]
MQNRERGAAHINIFYFLVAMVLFLGSFWFGYVQMSQVKGAIADRQAAELNELIAKRDLEHYQHYVEEISNLLGAKGDWAGKPNWKWDDRYQSIASANGSANPGPLPGVSLPADLAKSSKSLAQALGIPDTESSPLPKFFG